MLSAATTAVCSPMAKQAPANLSAYSVHPPTKVLCPIFAKDFSRKSRKNRKVIKISSSRSLSVWLRFTRNRCAIYWIPKAWLILKVYRFMRDQEKDFTVSFFFKLTPGNYKFPTKKRKRYCSFELGNFINI